jgi:hypothetical protein
MQSILGRNPTIDLSDFEDQKNLFSIYLSEGHSFISLKIHLKQLRLSVEMIFICGGISSIRKILKI